MRAREPDHDGAIERDGVQVGYEVFGDRRADDRRCSPRGRSCTPGSGRRRCPYLARHFRVITVEGRGNGRADRPGDRRGLRRPRVRRRRDRGAGRDRHRPGRRRRAVDGRAACAAARGLVPGPGGRRDRDRDRAAMAASPPDFDEPEGRATRAGRRRTGTTGWPTTAAGSSSSCPRSSPSRTRSSSGRTASAGDWRPTPRRCCSPRRRSARRRPRTPRRSAGRCGARSWSCTATRTGSCRTRPAWRWPGGPAGELVTLRGGGHAPTLRDPVQANLLIRDFVESLVAGAPRGRGPGRGPRNRRKRALFVSLADRARARAPRPGDRRRAARAAPRPGDRLAHPAPGDPGARAERGERVHPASRLLASESAHIESEAGEHDLHAFQAVRRMDEILVANFMVFHDLVDGRAVRPVDRRRGLGRRPLPVRQPRAQAHRLRLADRLRRLAADARRRRRPRRR